MFTVARWFDDLALGTTVKVVACEIQFIGEVEDFEVHDDERCLILEVNGTLCQIWEKDVDTLDVL